MHCFDTIIKGQATGTFLCFLVANTEFVDFFCLKLVFITSSFGASAFEKVSILELLNIPTSARRRLI